MINGITKQQYWQIVGLLALAVTHTQRLKDIETSIREILQVSEEDDNTSGIGDPSHIMDAIYSAYSADKLLSRLGINAPSMRESAGGQ